jgi:hypothetical protein
MIEQLEYYGNNVHLLWLNCQIGLKNLVHALGFNPHQ